MAKHFHTNNLTTPLSARMKNRALFNSRAYPENGGLGEPMIKDLNFVERIHYGVIDHRNNSIVPDENYIVEVSDGLGGTARVFDFVADAISIMRLNYLAAVEKGLIVREGSAFGDLSIVDYYRNPLTEYEKYLRGILEFYNFKYIPVNVGIENITSFEKYVNNFFTFIDMQFANRPLTLTRFNTSTKSSILNTGMAFSYADIAFDNDLAKAEGIILHRSFGYFKNLCLNMGFSILHNNPNILLFDISSTATESFRSNLGLFNRDILFDTRFNKTCFLDLDLLYNNINIHYNNYVNRYPQTKVVDVVCGKTVATYIQLERVSLNFSVHNDSLKIEHYIKIRNTEEGLPFSPQKLKQITKKAKYFLKKLDKNAAIDYINSEFRDQVWNKENGFHDLTLKLRNTTTSATRGISPTESSAQSTPSGDSYSGGVSSGTSGGSGGGSSSGY